MVVPPLRPLLSRDGTRLPDRLDHCVINQLPTCDEQDARQLAVGEPIVDGFEVVEFWPDRVRYAWAPARELGNIGRPRQRLPLRWPVNGLRSF